MKGDDEKKTLPAGGSVRSAPQEPQVAPATGSEGGPTGGGSGESGGQRWIGPYQIVSEIGRGGMGVVYRAFHPSLKRTVALKVLIAGEDASEEAIKRFYREAEVVAKLGHHPNIVPVFDIGRVGQVHYIAMHLVEGKPLDSLISDEAISPRRAARIARKVAGALQYAHSKGILHRDIKPANILMARIKVRSSPARVFSEGSAPPTIAEGTAATIGTGSTLEMEEWEPQVTDFGLARDVLSDSRFTASGATLGTPQYMPPEDTLAAAHNAVGDHAKAVEAQEEAMRVLPEVPAAERADFERRLREYRVAASRKNE